jgi:hypothetical protein
MNYEEIQWGALRVAKATGDAPDQDRLAELYNWKRGDPSGGVRFLNGAGQPVAGPGMVDWTGFPMTAAMEAAVSHELRRLQYLIDAIRGSKKHGYS